MTQCACINSREDATSTGGQRRRAFARIRERLRGIEKEARELIESIPVQAHEVPDANMQANRTRYEFELGDRDLDAEIRRIVEAWFATGGDDVPSRWFMADELLSSYSQGYGAERGRLEWLARGEGFSVADIGPEDARSILQSPVFRRRIERVYRRTFNEMKGFTGDLVTDLARQLSDGVTRGISPREVGRNIRDRLKVNEARAQKIARTEIGNSYRGARRDTDLDARDRLGMDIRQQWVSALAPGTRESHAARHLNIYTIEENEDFWAEDGNSINCLCRSQSVLVRQDGSVRGRQGMTKRDREERQRILDG